MNRAILVLVLAGRVPAAELPVINDPRFQIDLVAEHPRIVTPTGLAVDARGRLFAIESHTHQPKPEYPGPKTDRVKIFEDKDGDGSLESITIFAEGFRAAMNLALDKDGILHLVHRDGVLRLPDKNKDNNADAAEPIVTLETEEKYPHDGLGGIAFGVDGSLFLGFGENLGRAYTLRGSDGSTVKGGGEGGNVFRCRADGSKVELYATGFWNPFALSFDSEGNLFAVDNDPDGRPPCRLLHVIRGGDYGYQFRYGRSGLHPFVAWDGEIPGTLPMVAGTGEAPSGMLWLRDSFWPDEYVHSFLATSWGDNTLETFPLARRGASFQSAKSIFAKGDLSFRPVALAAGPKGVVYISDWADKEYPVHQKGRIWRLRGPARPGDGAIATAAPRDAVREIENLPLKDLLALAVAEDPFTSSAAIAAMAGLEMETLLPIRLSANADERLAALLALRKQGAKNLVGVLKRFLKDEDPRIRRIAIILAGEQRLMELKSDLLAAAMQERASLTLIETYLAADHLLSGAEEKSSQGITAQQFVGRLFQDESKPESLKQLARRLQPKAAGAAPQTPPTAIVGPRPETESEWLAAVGQTGGDPVNGKRVFLSEKAACGKCHRALGEGGQVGPDLAVIARSNDRAKLLNSILEPSANIGPLYVTHEIETKSGDEYSGLVLEKAADGALKLALADARVVEVPAREIKSTRTSSVSLMPDGVEQGLSVAELRDLLSFLESLK